MRFAPHIARPWTLAVAVLIPLGQLAFVNCSSTNGFSVTAAAGADYCRSQPNDAICAASVAVAKCEFNGSTVAEGSSVVAYLTSSVAAGGTCGSQQRTCRNGVLDGTYAYPACAVGAPAACLFNGVSLASGASVTAYRSSSETTCVPETRTCANGALSGSFAFAACVPALPASCLFNGQTVAHGTSITAYVVPNVPAGNSCQPITRTCYNGVLTGSGTYGSCGVNQPRSCLFNGQTVASGASVIAYLDGQVPSGNACVPQTRTCSDGTLSGRGDYASCVVNAPASCLLNGQTLPSGGSTTLYFASTQNADGLCPTETRVCANGNLSGSATFASCTVASADDGARVLLIQNGAAFSHHVGHADAPGSWTATMADGAGFLSYGPYVTTLPAAATLARFKLSVDNNDANNEPVAILDVFDSTTGSQLTTRTLNRQDFQNARVPQNFSLDFTPPAGHAIEFRVQFSGTAALTHESTEVRAEGLQRDMLRWVDSGIDESEYVAVHAEQRNCAAPYDACGPWLSVTESFQPFKTRWDNARQKMYMRKDDFNYDFYGEIWNLSPAGLTIRQETYPYDPSIDPAGASTDWAANGWIQPDRFRLFSLDTRGDVRPGLNPWPGAEGRLIAPRTVDWNWDVAQTMNTFRCYNWAQFKQGQCPVLQRAFQDSKISVSVVDDFSTDFDGVNSSDNLAWKPVDEFRSFERAVVINQEMYGTARERFFFAERAGRYYGLVRWDNSVFDSAHGRWVVIQRTTGVQRRNDHHVTFDGMIQRGLQDQ